MRAPAPPIRSYSLFGESAQLPDVLHCETIAARSALHDWELAPHRHARLHQLLLLTEGGGQAHLEGRAVPLAPPALVNVPAGDVHAFAFRPGTEGWVATLADELLDQIVAPGGAERRALARCRVLPAPTAAAGVMAQIGAEYGRQAPARALAVTPTHLSRVVRLATGAPASRLIEARVMREARRLLAYTNLQVATIAYSLGFADPAYFSRAFARAEGLPPRAFRARLDRPAPR